MTAIQHNGKWNRGNLNNPYTIMDNVQVTYNSGTWSYSPVAYWPTASGSYVSFFSYYLVSDEDYNGLSKSIAVDYNSGEMSMYLARVGANPIDQDVIYAVESNLSNANGGSVQFHYEHLLSKLNFKVSVSGNVSAITINSIGLKNFASEGIYNYVNNNISPDYVINTTDELMLIDEPLTLQSGQTEILESQLMLPQSLLASYTDGNSPAIVINYVVSSNGTQTESSLTYSLEKGFDSWDSGNSYTYTLKINSSSIIIDGEVGDFEDNGNADINPDSPDNPDQTPIEPQGGYVIPEGAKTYTVEVGVEDYVNVASMHNIAGLIAGADPEATIQMAYLNENGEMAWQDWTVTDGWFGVEGACYWGNGSIALIKPNADGTFAYICAFPDVEKVQVQQLSSTMVTMLS